MFRVSSCTSPCRQCRGPSEILLRWEGGFNGAGDKLSKSEVSGKKNQQPTKTLKVSGSETSLRKDIRPNNIQFRHCDSPRFSWRRDTSEWDKGRLLQYQMQNLVGRLVLPISAFTKSWLKKDRRDMNDK